LRKALVLLALLFSVAPLRADEAEAPAPAPAVPAAATATAALLDGPLSVSLGAEAMLALPAGWHWVAGPQLKAYFATHGHAPGPWDRGVALDADGREWRFIFEPGAPVGLADSLDGAALLAKAQSLAPAAGLQRWLTDPRWDAAHASLRLASVWHSGEEDSAALSQRWLARRGVLKLDWRGPLEQAEAAGAALDAMDAGLQWNSGQARAEALPAEAPKLALDAFAVEILLGRSARAPEATGDKVPLWGWIVGGLAGLGLLAWALYRLVHGLLGWLRARAEAKADAARLDALEKDYGGRAEDVEEIEEEGA
jgi:hypothetical protein